MLTLLLASAAILAAQANTTPSDAPNTALGKAPNKVINTQIDPPTRKKATPIKVRVIKSQIEKGPTADGWVYTQAGKPLQATVGLIPMANRNSSLSVKSVESRPTPSKKKPGFKLPIPKTGLYLLDVRASKHLPLQIPIFLSEEGIKDLKFMPRPEKPKGEIKPVSDNPKLARLEALYEALKQRESKNRAALRNAERVDWTADVEGVAKELQAETDPDTQSLLAISYLGLGNMLAKLDKATAALALEKLPATSPWWAAGTQYAGPGFAAADKNADYAVFRDALAKDNPDPEVRAAAMLAQINAYSRTGDREKIRPIYTALTTEYKDTSAAKSARSSDPDRLLINGNPFPAFNFKDMDSKTLNLDSFKGKTLLVNFWATSSRPSVNELPRLQAVHAKYKDHGFDILSLSLDKAVGDVIAFRAEANHEMPWQHVFLGKDSKDPLIKAVGYHSLPLPVLVGPDGKIVESSRTRLSGAYLMDTLDRVMKSAGVTVVPPTPSLAIEATPATAAVTTTPPASEPQTKPEIK